MSAFKTSIILELGLVIISMTQKDKISLYSCRISLIVGLDTSDLFTTCILLCICLPAFAQSTLWGFPLNKQELYLHSVLPPKTYFVHCIIKV